MKHVFLMQGDRWDYWERGREDDHLSLVVLEMGVELNNSEDGIYLVMWNVSYRGRDYASGGIN